MKLTKVLCYFSFGTLVAFVCCEVFLYSISGTGFGKVLPLTEPLLGQPDDYVGYAFRPLAEGMWTRENRAYVKINSLGLRDREVAEMKPPGVYRVAILGDSITEAFQVENEKTFENLAEDSLVSGGYKIELINLAMSGSGPLRQLVRLENNGLALSPDMAVFIFPDSAFLTGELFDDSQNPGYKYDAHQGLVRSYSYRERLSQRYKDTFIGKAFFFLMRNSHVLRALNMKREDTFLKFLNIAPLSFTIFKNHTTQKKHVSGACRASYFKNSHDLWVQHKPQQAWDGVLQFTRELSAVAAKNNIRIMIGMQLSLAGKDCHLDQKYRAETAAKMRGLFSQNKFVFIDWSRAAAENMNIPPYHDVACLKLNGFGLSLSEGHLNYYGHQVYAAVLEKALKSNLKQDLRSISDSHAIKGE